MSSSNEASLSPKYPFQRSLLGSSDVVSLKPLLHLLEARFVDETILIVFDKNRQKLRLVCLLVHQWCFLRWLFLFIIFRYNLLIVKNLHEECDVNGKASLIINQHVCILLKNVDELGKCTFDTDNKSLRIFLCRQYQYIFWGCTTNNFSTMQIFSLLFSFLFCPILYDRSEVSVEV